MIFKYDYYYNNNSEKLMLLSYITRNVVLNYINNF